MLQRAPKCPAAVVECRVAGQHTVGHDRADGFAPHPAATLLKIQIPGTQRGAVGQRETHQRGPVGQIHATHGAVIIDCAGHLIPFNHRHLRSVDALHCHRPGHCHPVHHRPIHNLSAGLVNAIRHKHLVAGTGGIHGVLDGRRGGAPTGVGRRRCGAVQIHITHRGRALMARNAKQAMASGRGCVFIN